MVIPRQGDIFWMESEQKRRPALVVTRSAAVPVLNRVLVAPVTSKIRGIGTEVLLDSVQGLEHDSAASFDNLESIHKSFLTRRIGTLPNAELEICRALGALADC